MVITGPLALSTIRAFRGVADLYYSGGQYIARSWPNYPKRDPTETQAHARQTLITMHALKKQYNNAWHNLFKQSNLWKGRTGEDLKRKIILWNLYEFNELKPPLILAATHQWNANTNDFTIVLYYEDTPVHQATGWSWRISTAELNDNKRWWQRVHRYQNRSGAYTDVITPDWNFFTLEANAIIDADKQTITLTGKSDHQPVSLWPHRT